MSRYTEPFVPAMVFLRAGSVWRRNYRRAWTGADYRLLCGKFSGYLLSEVDSESWLTWALNEFDGQLDHSLYRALIDQLNSLHH